MKAEKPGDIIRRVRSRAAEMELARVRAQTAAALESDRQARHAAYMAHRAATLQEMGLRPDFDTSMTHTVEQMESLRSAGNACRNAVKAAL